MSDDYQPIDCGLYDEYELAIMHKRPLDLQVTEAGAVTIRRVEPLDTSVADGAEYLVCRDIRTDESLRLRLDRIRMLTDDRY